MTPIAVQPPGDSPSYPTRKRAGTYRLVVAIGADDAPVVRQTVEIVWSGKWSDDPADFFTKELRVSLV